LTYYYMFGIRREMGLLKIGGEEDICREIRVMEI
jgi:hypothetical protein